LIASILACNAVDLAIGLCLVAARGWTVAAFALAGLLSSASSTWPHRLQAEAPRLGERGVFIVWGSAHDRGTYYVTAGSVPSWVWLASVPYALGRDDGADREAQSTSTSRTARAASTRFRVILGREVLAHVEPGPHGLVSTRSWRCSCGRGMLGPVACSWYAFAIPRLITVLQAYRQPKPAGPPPGYQTFWPLWYVSLAFYHNRLAGGLFVLGLAVNVASRL